MNTNQTVWLSWRYLFPSSPSCSPFWIQALAISHPLTQICRSIPPIPILIHWTCHRTLTTLHNRQQNGNTSSTIHRENRGEPFIKVNHCMYLYETARWRDCNWRVILQICVGDEWSLDMPQQGRRSSKTHGMVSPTAIQGSSEANEGLEPTKV